MNEDVVTLLAALRRTPLSWIADEIENEIAVGRLVEKIYGAPGRKRRIRATTVQDYDDEAQIEITLHCLANYLLVTPHYGRTLPLRIGREYLGLGTEFSIRVKALVANADNDQIHRMVKRHRGMTAFGTTPVRRPKVTDLVGWLAKELEHAL